jgi:hypothetical protein
MFVAGGNLGTNSGTWIVKSQQTQVFRVPDQKAQLCMWFPLLPTLSLKDTRGTRDKRTEIQPHSMADSAPNEEIKHQRII